MPSDIACHLSDVSSWLQTSVKRLSSGKDTLEAGSGLIVHYDTMRPHIKGIEDYSADHALISLLSAATLATIVTIKIERDRLLRQYRARRSLLARLGFGKKLPLTSIYENEDGLAKWAAKWDTFCGELERQRRGITLLTVESGPSGFCLQTYQAIAPVGQSDSG